MKKLSGPFWAVALPCRCILLLAILALFPAGLFAQATATQPAVAELTPARFDEPEPQPMLSADASWAGTLLIVVAAMFVAAAFIGPMVRTEAPREVPVAHSHDEPPGSSGHHGKSGTIEEPHHHHH